MSKGQGLTLELRVLSDPALPWGAWLLASESWRAPTGCSQAGLREAFACGKSPMHTQLWDPLW